MIILDTNVLSALMLQRPEPRVVAWLDAQPDSSIWTTAITVFEVRFGLALLPVGKRRSSLERAFDATLAEELAGRVLPVDDDAANRAGALAARRQRAGRPVDIRDLLIAGVAAGQEAKLATRNGRDFEGMDLDVVDPWSA